MAKTLYDRPGSEMVFQYPADAPPDEIRVAVYKVPNPAK
jgi:hypothetical protein